MRPVYATAGRLVALVALLTLLPASPASAHATLVATTPVDAALLDSGPAEVALRYDEPVSSALGAVRVIAPDGSRVDTGPVGTRDGGRTVFVSLRGDLSSGTYTVLSRILSTDSHTVAGASTFSVGRESATVAAAEAQRSGDGATAKKLLTVARFALYTGLVLLVGGVGFLLVLWPAGQSVRAARRVLWTGWALAVVGSAGGLLMQGPYAAGRPPRDAIDPALVSEVLDTRYGVATVVRLCLLAIAGMLLLGVGRVRHGLLVAAGSGVGVGLLLSTSAVGHADTGDLAGLALPADTLHLAAVSAWIGGLVLLPFVLRRHDGADPASVLARWSRYAAGAVAVILVTGFVASWQQVREPGALTTTGYGRLLLVKAVLVAVMLALGAIGRSWIRRHYLMPVVHAAGATADEIRSAPAPAAVTRLRRNVLMEAATATAVLVVTAVLVATTPAYVTYSPTFSQAAPASDALRVALAVTVAPARAGLNDMHISYTTPDGRAVDLIRVAARWTRRGTTETVPVVLTRTGVGRYERERVQLPAAGTWQLAVTSQTSDIDAATTIFTVRIR